MNKFLRTLFAFVLTLVVLTISPYSHVSAIQVNSVDHHTSNTSEHCTMLCQSSEAKKENDLKDASKEDDEPSPPCYLQFASVNTSLFVEKNTIPTSQTVQAPGKVPKYRLCCVVRQ